MAFHEIDFEKPFELDQRVEKALLHLAAMRPATAKAADEAGLDSESQLSLALDAAEDLATIATRLSVVVTRRLAQQISAMNTSSSARGTSLSITMHELRRPLTILNSYGQLLSTGMLGQMPDTATVAIDGITASTEMMVRMVNALAELSRLEDPDDKLTYEPIGLAELISGGVETVSMEAKLRDCKVAQDVSPELTFRGDRRRLTLALTNILGNAVKHSPDGSTITVRGWEQDHHVHITVRDQGPGFAARGRGQALREVLPLGRRAPPQGPRQRARPLHRQDRGRAPRRERERALGAGARARSSRSSSPRASGADGRRTSPPTRRERDSMGELEVPADAYYGASTMRARLNFPISPLRLPRDFMRALGLIKRQAAIVNVELGLLDGQLGEAIAQAAQEVADGQLDAQFVVDVFQTGSGTSTNMNANEVIGNRAIELLGGVLGSRTPVHPNDHVNLCQSSNDVIPTAIHVAGAVAAGEGPPPGARRPGSVAAGQEPGALAGRQDRAHPPPGRHPDPARSGVPGLGRPGRAGPAALPAGSRRALRAGPGRDRRRHRGEHPPRVRRCGSSPGWPRPASSPSPRPTTTSRPRRPWTAWWPPTAPCAPPPSPSTRSPPTSGCWPAARGRGSPRSRCPRSSRGPRSCPGKINPVIAESLTMVAAEVVGNDATIAFAGAAGSLLELNVMMPVAAHAPTRVDRHPRHRDHQLRQPGGRRHHRHRQRSAAGRAGADDLHRARSPDRLRPRRSDRQGGVRHRAHGARGGPRADRAQRRPSWTSCSTRWR